MQRRYGDRVEFLAVYVREAHPTDGWRMSSNDRVGISVAQPRTRDERTAVAQKCSFALEITMPVLVDELDDRVGHAYSGMPDRLYVIDPRGRVAYKSGRGPFGFKPGEMEQALIMLLLEEEGQSSKTTTGFPLLTQNEAWKRLPAAEKGAGQPLPAWARALADTLPRTTAAMLELDYLQRVRSPLDPVLRGKMRWVAAHANRCAFGEAQAVADLRRAGAGDNAVRSLGRDEDALAPAEKAALAFARKMTVAADTVSDAEVARLLEWYGDRQVVAMVLLLAYANFQDRLVLSLGLPAAEGALAPPEVRFAKPAPDAPPPVAAPRQAPAAAAPAGELADLVDPEWTAVEFAELQKAMEHQRERAPRIGVPAWEEVRERLPPGYPVKNPIRIKWSLVCLGYQPELAAAWGNCLRTFGREANQDRVFEESLFWVITRTIHCFY